MQICNIILSIHLSFMTMQEQLSSRLGCSNLTNNNACIRDQFSEQQNTVNFLVVLFQHRVEQDEKIII